jgi:hypothetical protein
MYCWNCGHKNADSNKFCTECGKTLLVPELPVRKPVEVGAVTVTRAEEVPRSQPAETNHLLDEPRVVREKLSFTPAPPSVPLPHVPPPVSKHVPESRNDRSEIPANRINGPSFLGLSDEPSVGEDSSYLLDDDQESSSWRGYLALAFLLIIGLLVVRQWTPIRDIAAGYAQRLGFTDSPKRPKPNPTVSASSATEQKPADATQSPTGDSANPTSSANPSAEVAKNVKPSQALGKPENDAVSEKATSTKPDNSATESKPEPKSAGSEPKSTDDSADSEESSTPAPSSKSRKSAAAKTPAATFDNSQVDLAQRYLQGKGVAQDCNHGVSLLRSAAREPNPKARIQMGALYASGHCVSQDLAQAYSWFAKAQELEPNNTWIERNLNSLWSKMTDEERRRVLR